MMKPHSQQSLALVCDAVYLCEAGRTGRVQGREVKCLVSCCCLYCPCLLGGHQSGCTAPYSCFFHKEEQRKKMKFNLLSHFEYLDRHCINTQRSKLIRWQHYKRVLQWGSLLKGSLRLTFSPQLLPGNYNNCGWCVMSVFRSSTWGCPTPLRLNTCRNCLALLLEHRSRAFGRCKLVFHWNIFMQKVAANRYWN